MKTAILAALVAVALPAAAQTTSTPRIDQRQSNQEARIQQGVNSGELTAKETAKLEKGQAKVQTMENKAVADGKVTPREQARIEKAQDKQSKKIAKKKSNKKKQPTA